MVSAKGYKGFLFILDIAVVALAFYSHIKSAWVQEELYKVCDADLSIVPGVPIEIKNCPSINLERFFLGAASGTLILSAIVGCFTSNKSIDIGYHALAAVVMLAGSVCFLLSTQQIDKLSIAGISVGFDSPEARRELLRTQKLAAGGLGILQGLLYGLTALALRKSTTATKSEQVPDNNFAQVPDNNFTQDSNTRFAHISNSNFEQNYNTRFAQHPNVNFEQHPNPRFAQHPNFNYVQQHNIGFAQHSNTHFEQYPNTGFAQHPNSRFAQHPNTNFEQYPNTHFSQYPNTNFAQYPSTRFGQTSQVQDSRKHGAR